MPRPMRLVFGGVPVANGWGFGMIGADPLESNGIRCTGRHASRLPVFNLD